VEIIWTTIPFLILVAMAVPATTTLLALEDTRDADMSIQVTAYQWKWKYDYLDEDISFFSVLTTPRDQIEGDAVKGENYLQEVDNPIVVPINKTLLVGAGPGLETGCGAGLHQRCLDRTDRTGYLPRQVCRTLW
jgi:heme/copper-type cytochrome/quinol oxidase subunit 2